MNQSHMSTVKIRAICIGYLEVKLIILRTMFDCSTKINHVYRTKVNDLPIKRFRMNKEFPRRTIPYNFMTEM